MNIIIAQKPIQNLNRIFFLPVLLVLPTGQECLSATWVWSRTAVVLMPDLVACGERCSLEKCKRIGSVVMVSPKVEVLTSVARHF